MERKAYICRHPDRDILRHSSSGGVFSALAGQVLAAGGVVFGAAFDERFGVVHRAAETPAEAAAFMGSKYLQSDTTGCFPQVQAYLRQGRRVLFTGTPCQAAGLRAFLGSGQQGLLVAEVACHGAPSPLVWQKYLAWRAGGVAPAAVNFRSKSTGWKGYSLQIERQNDTTYETTFRQDPYMQAFLNDLILRPACHSCAFKLAQSAGDILMADCWGADKLCPQDDDDTGLSLVLPLSEQGQQAWDGLSGQLWWRELPAGPTLQYNKSILRSVAIPALRRPYWKALRKNGFDISATTIKFTSSGFGMRLYRALNRLLLSKILPPAPRDGREAAKPPQCAPLYDGKRNCCGCSTCQAVCPTAAISMAPDSEGFLYPVIDPAACVGCGRCVKTCPVRARQLQNSV